MAVTWQMPTKVDIPKQFTFASVVSKITAVCTEMIAGMLNIVAAIPLPLQAL